MIRSKIKRGRDDAKSLRNKVSGASSADDIRNALRAADDLQSRLHTNSPPQIIDLCIKLKRRNSQVTTRLYKVTKKKRPSSEGKERDKYDKELRDAISRAKNDLRGHLFSLEAGLSRYL
jgi:hypothetical protein